MGTKFGTGRRNSNLMDTPTSTPNAYIPGKEIVRWREVRAQNADWIVDGGKDVPGRARLIGELRGRACGERVYDENHEGEPERPAKAGGTAGRNVVGVFFWAGMKGVEAKPKLLEHLEKLLGEDVFFVPCEWGTKRPRVTPDRRMGVTLQHHDQAAWSLHYVREY
jgi:hypothetical protein